MNIAEILKSKPKGYPLYSPMFGECELVEVHDDDLSLPIVVEYYGNLRQTFTPNGKYDQEGECLLFPSKDNRDWNSINRFNVNILKPFDKVLVRNSNEDPWTADLFSHSNAINGYKFACVGMYVNQCVPYNDDTKHLIGTLKDCPDYYKTW